MSIGPMSTPQQSLEFSADAIDGESRNRTANVRVRMRDGVSRSDGVDVTLGFDARLVSGPVRLSLRDFPNNNIYACLYW